MRFSAKRLGVVVALAAFVLSLSLSTLTAEAQSGPNILAELQRGIGGNTELYQFAPGAAGGQKLAESPANLLIKLSAGGQYQAVFGYDPTTQTSIIQYGPTGGALRAVTFPQGFSPFFEPVFDATGGYLAYSAVGPIEANIWALNFIRLSDGAITTFEGKYVTQDGQQNESASLGVGFPLEGWSANTPTLLLGSAIPYADGNFAGYHRLALPANFGGASGTAPMPSIERLPGLPISLYQPTLSLDSAFIAFPTSEESKVTDWIGAYGPLTGVRVVGGFAAFATGGMGSPAALAPTDLPIPAGLGVGNLAWGASSTLYYTVGQYNQSSVIQNVRLFGYTATTGENREIGALTTALGLALYDLKICGNTAYYTLANLNAQQPEQALFSVVLDNPAAPTELIRAANIRLRECR